MRWISAFVAAWLGVVVAVRAGDVPSAGSMTSAATGESHGWFVMPTKLGVAVQHVPPRGRDSAGRPGVEDGGVRVATTLTQMPVAIAAVENRVYLVFGPTPGMKGASKRTVLVLEAQRGSMDGDWVGEANEGRLPSVTGLPGEGELRGFVGSPVGPVALMGEAGGMRLLRLMGDGWTEIPLPEVGPGQAIGLVGTTTGIAVLVNEASRSGAWVREVRPRKRDQAIEEEGWEWRPLKFVDGVDGRSVGTMGDVVMVRGRFIAHRYEKDRVEIREVSEGGGRLLAEVPGVARGYAVVPLDQTGRIALVWRESGEAGVKGEKRERLRVAEVSALTGQLLFVGDAEPQRPFSSMELRLLAAFLVLVMLAIVVFVLRPESTLPAVSLPKGVSLAEPGRRLIAGVLDAGLAVLVASQVTGIKASAMFDLRILVTKPDALTLYLAAVGIGAGLGVLCEWLFGRTFGKALTGLETVRPVFIKSPEGEVRLELSRVSLPRALARNVVKWVLPPVAMSGLATPDRRHRGDVAAGTIVIVREEDAGA